MAQEPRNKGASQPLAYVLWVLVGAALLYGVSQTAIKAFALFTG